MTRLVATIFLAVVIAAPISAQAKPGTDTKKAAPMVRATEKRVWPDEGPATWTERKTVPAITANDLRTRLYQFADDSMMGRRVGELGNYKGTDYIASEFKRLGLKPAGDSGTYFQTLPFGPVGFDSASLRLSAGGTLLATRTDWVPLRPTAANGLGFMADFVDAPTVFGGRADETAPLDPAVYGGKVVVLAAVPGFGLPALGGGGGGGGAGGRGPLSCDEVPNRFGARAAAETDATVRREDSLAGRGRFAPPRPPALTATDVVARAQRAGARGVILVSLDGASPGALNNVLATGNAMRPTQAPGALPAASVSLRAADQMFGQPVSLLQPGTAGKPITASWSFSWRPAQWAARNVIAILPGSDPARAGEYVLVGAHNDHVGTNNSAIDHDSVRAVNWVTRPQGANDPVCRPTADQQRRIDSMIARARSIRAPRRDSIMNGADDDGSGTVVLLEIAEQFAKEKPARSIIFVSHQAEEGGLLGSRWFADNPTVPLNQVVAAHNMDMLGKGRPEYVKFGGPASLQTLGSRRLSREFGDIIDSVNAVRSEVMAIDKTWDVTANPMNRFCRSDQVNYVRKDVPVTYFSTGYSPDYHQASDEPRYVEYEHSARVARFIHDVMMAIAMRKDRPAIAGPDPSYPRC